MADRSARSVATILLLVLAATSCGESDPADAGNERLDASVSDGRAGGAADTAADTDAHATGGGDGRDAQPAPAGDGGPPGGPCGYKGLGEYKTIGTSIELCLPPVVCTPSETCPRGLGDCVGGKCVYKPGFSGVETLPEAWTTQYCDLTTGGCNGAVQDPLPYDVARTVAQKVGPVCADQPTTTGTCVGIAAPPPRMAGNSQLAIDPATGKRVALWGLGMTAASGLCYEITGDGGTAVVAITDRCAGYCKCGAGAYNECGNCINAPDTTTQCACVGTAPPLYTACCGRTCGATGQCDWCANGNHPHFDLDNATFQHVCGDAGPMYGSCKLSKVRIVKDCYPARASWPN